MLSPGHSDATRTRPSCSCSAASLSAGLRRYHEAEADLRRRPAAGPVPRDRPTSSSAALPGTGGSRRRRSAHFQRALERQPAERARVYDYLADALNQTGDLAGAHRALEQALEPRPARTARPITCWAGCSTGSDGRTRPARCTSGSRELRRRGDSGGRRRSRIHPSGCRVAAGRRGAGAARARRCPGSIELAGERFAAQRRTTTPLEAGAAVVTGGGDLAAPFVLHVVLRDERSPVGRDVVRRALVSAWQRAGDWALGGGRRPAGRRRRRPAQRRGGGGPAGRDLSAARGGGPPDRAPDRGGAGRRARDAVEAIVRRYDVIRLTDLVKRYGKFTAVDGINLEVPRGELFGLLGPNGAGKTTTIRMIAGILRPTSRHGRGGGLRHPHPSARGQGTGWATSPTGPSSTTSSPAASSSASPPRSTARTARRSSAGSTSCWSCSS